MAQRTKKLKRKSPQSRKALSGAGRVRSHRAKKSDTDEVVEATGTPPNTGEDRIQRLWGAIQDVRAGRRTSSRTAKLLDSGVAKMAQKIIEEAAEVGIEGVRNDRSAMINESADLLYNLVVSWTEQGIAPEDVWQEMDRREALLGMAEKLPKSE